MITGYRWHDVLGDERYVGNCQVCGRSHPERKTAGAFQALHAVAGMAGPEFWLCGLHRDALFEWILWQCLERPGGVVNMVLRQATAEGEGA